MAARVWTNRRKWIGNLLPTLFFLPPVILGVIWMNQNSAIWGKGLWLVVSGTFLGWVALNFFGLWANGFMKRTVKRELTAKLVNFEDPHIFVGFAKPRFFSMLDAHEDIGYLFLRPEILEFVGEVNHVKINRADIQQVRFRPNVHTWVGLGRWITVEGKLKETTFRLSIEPRERNFLLLNLLASGKIRDRILRWAAKGRKPTIKGTGRP